MTLLVKIDGTYYIKGKTECFNCDKPIKYVFAISIISDYIGTPIYCEDCDYLLKKMRPGQIILQELEE